MLPIMNSIRDSPIRVFSLTDWSSWSISSETEPLASPKLTPAVAPIEVLKEKKFIIDFYAWQLLDFDTK